MPPASAQNRPPLYVNLAGGREYEYRPNVVNGVLQWVLRPVYTFAYGYYIRMLIRRIRAARDFDAAGYNVSGVDGGPSGHSAPYMVNRRIFGPGGV